MTAIDEETGMQPNHSSNYSNTNEDDSETTGLITGESRKLTNASLNSTNVSDSEYLDYVSEMSPLRQHHQHHTVEVAPLPPSYGGLETMIEAPKYPLRRRPSDESINTVTALPGMVIRCHSIHNASSRRRGEGTCSIRPSTTKVVSWDLFTFMLAQSKLCLSNTYRLIIHNCFIMFLKIGTEGSSIREAKDATSSWIKRDRFWYYTHIRVAITYSEGKLLDWYWDSSTQYRWTLWLFETTSSTILLRICPIRAVELDEWGRSIETSVVGHLPNLTHRSWFWWNHTCCIAQHATSTRDIFYVHAMQWFGGILSTGISIYERTWASSRTVEFWVVTCLASIPRASDCTSDP